MAATVTIAQVLDVGNDVVVVRGAINGQPVTVRTWRSAFTNYFPASAYSPDGTIKAGQVARAATNAEILAYCKSLVQAQNLDLAASAPVDLGISG